MDSTPHPILRHDFALTRWTLVQRARGESTEARAALSDLCALYYGPVETFIRCQGVEPEAARDLTQEFFARLLGGSGVTGAEAGRGRFRSYLLGAVKHFLQVERPPDLLRQLQQEAVLGLRGLVGAGGITWWRFAARDCSWCRPDLESGPCA